MAIQYYFSWQFTEPDRFGNMALFNAGSADAYNVRLEPENSAIIEPRTFSQSRIPPSGFSDRFKAKRGGAARYPSVRIIWSDRERTPYSVVMEIRI